MPPYECAVRMYDVRVHSYAPSRPMFGITYGYVLSAFTVARFLGSKTEHMRLYVIMLANRTSSPERILDAVSLEESKTK
jgi:hypothetical protein